MTVTIRHGDCREVLLTLPEKSVHCCVTSPPYFGLRDYGHAGQIGLEATPDAFVAEMVAVFREVRRVLRDDGTLWLNLGDSYCSTDKWGGGGNVGKNTVAPDGTVPSWAVRTKKQEMPGVKPKDLIGIPWRVAFALQADGWYLRQDIIWSKPNPMPESVTDRCTKAHEYIFLMSKSARYYYDAKAISEVAEFAGKTIALGDKSFSKGQATGANVAASGNGLSETYLVPDTRNKRSVWTVTTQPYSDAHFATFPPDLIEPCIKAGCPAKACIKCGSPWTPISERGCYCADFETTSPGTVLDPFGGAGTTGLVADRLKRDAILIELNPEYATMAKRRIESDAGMFAQVQT